MTLLNFPSFKSKKEVDGWKLLEEKTINDRTIIVWYNPEERLISLIICHGFEQPNDLSKKSPYSHWGYVTHFVTKMYTPKEAAEVVSLYLKDMENDNFWWEKGK
jgi:hypothetical protein